MAEPGFDLERVIATAAEAVAPPDLPRFVAFARAYLRGGRGAGSASERSLAGATAAGFAFAAARAIGEICVRVANSPDRPGRTVIQVLQDDRPFIVDTLRLLLRRAELRERLLLHPILPVRRDVAGSLLGVDATPAAPRESALYVEVSPRIDDPSQLAELETSLRDAMEKVRDVTEDHARMLAAIAELYAQVDHAGRTIPDGAERARRVRSFLEWLVADHFVLVGFRRYALRSPGDAAGFEVELVPGSGLGLFRDDATSRLRTPRRGAEVPEELRDIVADPRILVIGKSRVESPIHRHGRLDRLAVTQYDERGEACGLAILFGLFTSRALRTPGSQVPLLSNRLEEIVRREAAEPRSHRYRAILGAFDSAPLEVLLGTDVDGVAALIHEIVESEGSKGVRVVLRADPHGRSLYVAVLLPRERYAEELRTRIRSQLVACTGATYVDDRASFLEEGAAVLHYFCTTASGRLSVPDPAVLEAEIEELSSRWEDRFEAALVDRFGESEGVLLADRYTDGYPELLRVATHPVDAARGVVALEALAASGAPHFALYFDHDGARCESSTLDIFLPDQILLLSDLLPVIDGFGIRVIDAQQLRVTPVDRPPAMVATLRVLPLGATQDDLDAIAERLGEAIRAVLLGAVASDPLNRLVLGAGLAWREIDCVRAYLEYFLQIQ
ncbi:MAG: gdhA, partial [Deltaproteobacteria bacterium]|nr:gdhA [Deltaproteobacteria bacterium]